MVIATTEGFTRATTSAISGNANVERVLEEADGVQLVAIGGAVDVAVVVIVVVFAVVSGVVIRIQPGKSATTRSNKIAIKS